MKKYTALFLVCCLAVLLPAKHIIFDLGGVLLSSSKMKVARSIGLTRFATSFFKHGHYPLDAVKGMFDIIDMIEPSTKTD